MDPALWQRAQEIYAEACAQPPAGRAAWLEEACAGDAALLGFVLELLEAETRDHPAARALDQGPQQETVAAAFDLASTPQHIEGFRIRAPLGQGGMGSVFLADQLEPARPVALKLMRQGLGSPLARARFQGESSILARLSHPAIAQIYATGTCIDPLTGQELPWFAMELVAEAASLTAYAAQHCGDVAQLLELFLAVCEGVQHGHLQGYVHRDLKPHNVLVDAGGHPKIIDFGIAKILGEETGEGRTQAGELLGTLQYMSPEQLERGDEAVDQRADIYALGVMLYELASGRPAHQLGAASLTEAIDRLRQEPTPRLQPGALRFGLARGDAEDLSAIVWKAMQRDPGQRYASVSALVEDLRRLQRHEAVQARPPHRGYLLARFVRRNRLAVGAAAGVLLSLLAGIIGTSLQMLRARQAERQLREALAEVRLEAEMSRASHEFLREALRAPNPYQDGRELRVVDLLDRMRGRAQEMYSSRLALRASLLQTLGNTYVGLGQAEAAAALLEPAVELGRRELGAGHPQCSRAMQSLAHAYVSLDRRDAARELITEALQARRELVEGDDEDLARCTYVLGLLEHHAGDYPAARRLLQDARAMMRARLGPEHRDTIRAGSALGEVLFQLGALPEALQVLRETLEDGRRGLGEDDPSVLVSANNLARVQLRTGEKQAAAATFRAILGPHERVFGEEHAQTLLLLSNIASTDQQRGAHEEAAQAYQTLIARRAAAGLSRHHHTAVAYNNLGVCQREAGELEAAAQSFGRALELLRECKIPPRHWLTAVFRIGLARVHIAQGRRGEAARSLRDCIEILEAAKGDQSARLQTAREALALATSAK